MQALTLTCSSRELLSKGGKNNASKCWDFSFFVGENHRRPAGRPGKHNNGNEFLNMSPTTALLHYPSLHPILCLRVVSATYLLTCAVHSSPGLPGHAPSVFSQQSCWVFIHAPAVGKVTWICTCALGSREYRSNCVSVWLYIRARPCSPPRLL